MYDVGLCFSLFLSFDISFLKDTCFVCISIFILRS